MWAQKKVSIGFEPMKDGFADRSLRPLGYDTIDNDISKLLTLMQVRKSGFVYRI